MPIIAHLFGFRLRGKKPFHGGVEIIALSRSNANYWGSVRPPRRDNNGINKKYPEALL